MDTGKGLKLGNLAAASKGNWSGRLDRAKTSGLEVRIKPQSGYRGSEVSIDGSNARNTPFRWCCACTSTKQVAMKESRRENED
jgi:hypothetical protein